MSQWLEERLPAAFTVNLKTVYRLIVAERMNAARNQTILDVGSGKMCWFAQHREAGLGTQIVGCDLSEEELRENLAVDYRIVTDATKHLPFRDESVDILTTRSTLEHLPNLDSFLSEAQRVLKPGGNSIHIFPCRFSPFAILNRLLPHRVAQSLLYYFQPQWKETCGFKAYYDRCYFSKFSKLLTRNQFNVEKIHLGYYQSIYYNFFFPLYLLFLSYDFFLYVFGVKDLAAQMVVVSRKAGG